MKSTSRKMAVERAFDAGDAGRAELDALCAGDPALGQYRRFLEDTRAALAARPARPQVEDAQFRAFMAGVSDQLDDAPAHAGAGRRTIWAALSLMAAALVVSVASFYVLTQGPDPVEASTVEATSTELEGASVDDWYDAEHGVTTVWVTESQDDLW